MYGRLSLAGVALALLIAPTVSADSLQTIDLVTPHGRLKKNTTYPLTFVAKLDTGKVAASQQLRIDVITGSDTQVAATAGGLLGSTTTVTTDANGSATASLRTGEVVDVKLRVTAVTPITAGEVAVEWTSIATYTVDTNSGPLVRRTAYPNAISITAKGKDDRPASLQQVRVRVIGESDAMLFTKTGGQRDTEVIVNTDTSGRAAVSLETGETVEVQLLVSPLETAGDAIARLEKPVELSALRTFDTFHSRRLFTEVFVGATFTNDYDEHGETTGFNRTSPLARVTFDTIWFGRTPRAPGLFRGSLLHTGVDMEFSSFPFGEDATEDDDDEPGDDRGSQKGLQSAFSGAIFAVWQPDKWASYTQTSERTGTPTDALRWGIIGKLGVTTRPSVKADNGDTSFGRAQIGIRLTHHQTKVRTAGSEQDNVVPIRFVELSYGRFEEFANEVDANRLVFDAGFRLPGLGSNMIPFYAGIHLNAGRGPDDLRVFAGFLFKINEIATLFQRAGTN